MGIKFENVRFLGSEPASFCGGGWVRGWRVRRPPGGGILEASPHHDSITFWRSRNNRSTHLAARLRLGWHGGPALALGPSVLVHADLCGRAPRRVPAIPWDPPSCTPASPVRAGQAWAAAEAPPTVAPQIL